MRAAECRQNAEESLCLAKTAELERECSIYWTSSRDLGTKHVGQCAQRQLLNLR